jgi:hypothetical protein
MSDDLHDHHRTLNCRAHLVSLRSLVVLIDDGPGAVRHIHFLTTAVRNSLISEELQLTTYR